MARLPDFIIGGAPKCGTTSLHFILGQNPEIGIPNQEIHYFDADDPITHPDFLTANEDGLKWFTLRPDETANLDWYASCFSDFQSHRLIGEDSTTYLFSAVAARRIKALLPDVKLVFLLRDPVRRAYSQYWHLICSGRLTCSFEQAVSQHSSIVLGSTYAPHLAEYFRVLGRENVHVALFEDFLANKQSYLDGVTAHIGASKMDVETLQTWFNRTKYPSPPKGQQIINFLGRPIVAQRYHNHMGHESGLRHKIRKKVHYQWFKRVNPLLLTADKPPAMKPETEKFLRVHLSDRNAGLSEMLERDLSKVWPEFSG